jgi:hypothetical protein
MAYEQISGPLGPERGDIHMAVIAANIANANSGKGQRAKPQDFLPKWDQQGGRQSWEDMLAAVKTMNRRLGGTDLTAEGGDDADGPDSGGAAGSGRDRHGGPDQWRERRR